MVLLQLRSWVRPFLEIVDLHNTLFSMPLSIFSCFISQDTEYSACSSYTFRPLCVLHFIHKVESKILNYCVVQYILINLFLVCPRQHLVDIQHHHWSTPEQLCGHHHIWYRDSGKALSTTFSFSRLIANFMLLTDTLGQSCSEMDILGILSVTVHPCTG